MQCTVDYTADYTAKYRVDYTIDYTIGYSGYTIYFTIDDRRNTIHPTYDIVNYILSTSLQQ